MKQNIKVEAEHNELILENSHGDKVIIPANKRNWVKQKLSEGCHDCIDSLVETLPVASQYAQDGSVYPPNTKVKVSHNNQIKEYDISSPEYRDLYNSGKLMSYDKTTDTYSATPLKEVTITAEAPEWLKYKREYEKTNPKSNYINNHLTPFAKSLGNTKTNYPKRLDDEYEQKSLDYVSEQLVKNKPQGKLSRAEWLNQMSDKEEELIKRNPKYQSSLWADTKRGLTSLVEQNPLQTFQNILNSSDYTNREKQEMLKDYNNHPVMSKLGDAIKILNPLTVPSKMVQSSYKDDYSFSDALKGKKNNAGIVEDIVTDPLNLVGVGLAGKLSKADKVIDATKILNKIDNNSFYRQIGKEGYEDAIKTGVIRSKPIGEYAGKAPYFVEGKDFDKLYSTGAGAYGKKPKYIFEMPQLKNPEEMSAFRVNQQEGYAPYVAGSKEIPISQGKIYRLNNKNEYELVDATKAGSKVLNKIDDVVNTAKPIISSVDDAIKNKPVQNGFLFDKKGFMQQYPKGNLTEMEINAVRNTNEYKKMQFDHLKMKEKYGNNWKLGNFYEDAIQKNDRDAINRILYGGSNYNKLNYAGTAIVGYVGVSLPSTLGLLGLSTFGDTNQILNTHKKIGLYDPTDLGFLTSKDTVIDISDKKMDYAKVNENKDGKVILGGEFIEEANNSVRKVKDWIDVDSLDTFGDKKIKTKDINKFYGVENNKFKVGTLKDFDKETEVVPVRFKDTPIKKAVLNNKQLRLLDNDDKPIYQNTPNTGKFILHSPSSKKSIFVYINEGKKGVDEVNKFLKQNGDAFYIHLDNGRYEFYGINEDGLTKQNFENYYEQDLKRENNPGYNLIIK